MNLKEYVEFRDRSDTIQRKLDRTRGAIDSIISLVEKDFDCQDIKEAKKLLEKLEGDQKQLEKDFKEAFAVFMEKLNGRTAESETPNSNEGE
jgi:hypothetical protein